MTFTYLLQRNRYNYKNDTFLLGYDETSLFLDVKNRMVFTIVGSKCNHNDNHLVY